ncbi:MAG: isoprenylcysteine carboxylmethyltransferase family protein [Mucilaginibacter sp.]
MASLFAGSVKRKDKWYVGNQLLLLTFYLFDFYSLRISLAAWARYAALTLALAGVTEGLVALYLLRKHITPFPSPLPEAVLVNHGLYKYIRHPIYGGIIAFTVGYAFYSQSLSRMVTAFGLVILFYFKSMYEERQLQQKFPGYQAYKKDTYRFLPFL